MTLTLSGPHVLCIKTCVLRKEPEGIISNGSVSVVGLCVSVWFFIFKSLCTVHVIFLSEG